MKKIVLSSAVLLVFILLVGLSTRSVNVKAQPGDLTFYLPAVWRGKIPGDLVVLGWNDLGMHCYNRDFSDLAVLPPYNNLYVQVIQRGDPPKVVTQGITISYRFASNTYSVGKSNFWTYAQALFGLSNPLSPNIGLTGKGLSGAMDLKDDHFTAEGIPLTEYDDSDWNNRQPFQLATIEVKNANGQIIASQQVVAPVSTEMRCDFCHGDSGEASDEIATGKVELNILTLHDKEEHTNLVNTRPVLCAGCHASNALGTTGDPEVPNLSRAMHSKHSGEVADTLAGCYSCHPGPTTKCLRDVMSTQHAMTCVDCHGTLSQVAQNPDPWLKEPSCASSQCHSSAYSQDQVLYRNSKGHGGVFCEGCHDSTHAVAPSVEARDAIKFINLQGHNGPLDVCTTCHVTRPASGGPHR